MELTADREFLEFPSMNLEDKMHSILTRIAGNTALKVANSLR